MVTWPLLVTCIVILLLVSVIQIFQEAPLSSCLIKRFENGKESPRRGRSGAWAASEALRPCRYGISENRPKRWFRSTGQWAIDPIHFTESNLDKPIALGNSDTLSAVVKRQ
jgi:hypothetical protein